MGEEQCDNCKYWVDCDSWAECRRHAPRWIANTYIECSDWSLTISTDWCGDYAAR